MRKDISVYNEAKGFTIHSAGFCGLDRASVIENLKPWVEEGVVLAQALVQDEPLSIRVMDGNLTVQEEAEWVCRVAWKLQVPDGQLVFEGGLDPKEDRSDFQTKVTVKPGTYWVEIYTLFWGLNGESCLSPGDAQYEPVGAWFRRTHPGKRFSVLLKSHLAESPADDPGHEEFWEKFAGSDAFDDLDPPDQVDFLVRLTPLPSQVPGPLVSSADGWFPVCHQPRKPERCPVGLNLIEE